MKSLLCLLLLALITTPAVHAADTAGDPFAVGKVWTGKRRFEKDNGKLKKGAPQEWSLRITERTGEEFKGVITIDSNVAGDNFEVGVSGVAPAEGDGNVTFKSEAKGDFRQSFFGKIKNGSLALDFKGKSAAGESVDGVAGLTPKN